MKRSGGIYEHIAEAENLRLAFWKARRGKDGKPEVEEFRNNLDAEIERMRDDILAERVAWGEFHTFTVNDPKVRTICAAPFRDRVLHHAVMNLCEPVFESFQIYDSYACRKGKGLHACLERAKRYTRRHNWFLKLDVRKYFDSVSQPVLMNQLQRKFKDKALLRLFAGLLERYCMQPGRGIPIGNLTSQFFANHYLAGMDHLCKETLHIPGYVRYMDDFVLWADDRETLLRTEKRLRDYCAEELKLELKPACLNRTALGLTMLGYRVFPQRVLLARRSRRRFARKLGAYWNSLQKGEWSQDDFAAHVLPLAAYVGHADSVEFRRAAMKKIGCSPQARTA